MKRRLSIALTGVALLAIGVSIATTRGQDRGRRDLFPNLIESLKKSPGCLGLETARTDTGKNVVFVWFKDKKAVLDWYESDVHQEFMEQFFGGATRVPLDGVPDDVGPVMAIASITMAENPQLTTTKLPISQIAIELYQPVTGGLALGGRFAPDSLKVKNLKVYTPGK